MTDKPIEDDPFVDALRGLPEWEMSTQAREEHLRMLASLAVESPQRKRGRRRFTIAAGSLVLACGVGVGTAAALGVFKTEPPPDRRIAHCYTSLDLHNPDNHIDFGVATAPGAEVTEPDAAKYAMDVCTGAWMQGRFSLTNPKVLMDPKLPPWNYPVPPLIACVLQSGEVAVFPGTPASCAHLGLAVAELQVLSLQTREPHAL